METTQRFDRAIQALVKGYFNNTLVAGNCQACAVGNIVAAGVGGQLVPVRKSWLFECTIPNQDWRLVFLTQTRSGQRIRPYNYVDEAKAQIDSTGYSWQELARVETAFEGATKIKAQSFDLPYGHGFTPEQIDADQYAGLIACVDVLCDIEGIADATEYKALFAKPISA